MRCIITMLHILDTEDGWRMLVEQGAETPLLAEQDVHLSERPQNA